MNSGDDQNSRIILREIRSVECGLRRRTKVWPRHIEVEPKF